MKACDGPTGYRLVQVEMNLRAIKLCAIKIRPVTIVTWHQYLLNHLLESWARKPVQPQLRWGGKSRGDLSPLGLRGRGEVSLCACPRMMCMTGAGTTLTLLCRCHVTALPTASNASPPSLPSTPLGHAPNALIRRCILRIVSHHLIQPLSVSSRGPRANHHPPCRSPVIQNIWHDTSLWMWSSDEAPARGVATRGIRIYCVPSKDGTRQKMSCHKSLQPVQKYRV
ncbi:hypothetical protein PIB30_009203 [Stylosanthes scabra]|uniref:Uncharacterized protein n=1 Tax=Stylosanthes scabra TaxID=79078 RepID=A0ABU6Z1X4_9FABA|nr:hypothetical protein [Stylosanthes scabra]